MRCKKHLTDLSSTVGVCASCLREKLFPLLAVQSPPLIFPRSVSPPRVHKYAVDPSRLFYSTPQLRPPATDPFRREKEKTRFSLFPKFFRSSATSSSSPSWISNLFFGRKKNPPPEASAACRRPFPGRGRGLSPARVSDCGADDFDDDGSSGYSTEGWRQTPRRSGAPAGRRNGGGRGLGSQNVAAFCLSPLVRPSPNRRWDPKAAAAAESQVAAVRPCLAAAAASFANRSRKMADFGRLHRRQ